jgi:hypothetical protein
MGWFDAQNSMLKIRFIGRGTRLEFYHAEYRTPIVTSAIQEIQECAAQPGCPARTALA